MLKEIIWTKNLGYVIGLIASDGNLSKTRKRIQIKSADLELVENFKKALKLKEKIGITKSRKGKDHYYIMFSNKDFYDFLISIGIHPKKSHTIKALNIPERFFCDFLRGFFDGDGTFYTFWDKRWPNSFCFQISFASASKEFIYWLKEENSRLFSVKGFVCIGKNVYNLRYVKGDTRKIFKTMYYNNCSFFLSRKRLKMQEAFKKDEIMPR